MDGAEVLVSIEDGGETGAIVKDADGRLSLSDSTERVRGTGIQDYRPHHQGLGDGRTLMGGRLAPGAATAEVIDDAGQRHEAAAANGAWVAIIDQPISGPTCPVCHRDSDGRPVAPPLPESWPRIPVADATVPCPACGARSWDEVKPDDDSRGGRHIPGGRMEPTPFVVCRTCGHEESIGGVIRFTRGEDEDPAAAARGFEAAQRQLRESQRFQLTTVDFPIYAVDGLPATMVGCGGSGGRTVSVKAAHGADHDEPGPAVHVETAEPETYSPGEYALARRHMEMWAPLEFPELPDDASDVAVSLAFRAAQHEQRRRAATAARGRAVITVDGRPTTFTIIRSGSRWVAVHEGPERTLTISGNEVDPAEISLSPLTGPIEQLLGE